MKFFTDRVLFSGIQLAKYDCHSIERIELSSPSRNDLKPSRLLTIVALWYRKIRIILFVRISISLLQGIMLVYDITSEKSFDNIKNWIRNIEEVNDLFRLCSPLFSAYLAACVS